MRSLKNRLDEAFTPPKGIEFSILNKNRVVLFTKDSTKNKLTRSDDSKGQTLDELGIKFSKGDEFTLDVSTKKMDLVYDLVITGENDMNYTTKEKK